jgi:hypothetical protein
MTLAVTLVHTMDHIDLAFVEIIHQVRGNFHLPGSGGQRSFEVNETGFPIDLISDHP